MPRPALSPWLAIPCLEHKPHLIAGTVHDNDFAERTPSARAQAAIDADERENQQ
ncbi:hypothetical protein [Nocardia vulneris]|uniref:hypothetical protein n=1 Tax=Nocardia vulneris TaxID=1141657 RepID=UPI000A5107A5|nr:hypothetical protein [Nocardia vulneris]